MIPGWYPDPFSDGFLRWWDGTTWTTPTRPNVPLAMAWGPNPHGDLANEERAGRRASVAVIAGAVGSTAVMFLYAWAFGGSPDRFLDVSDPALVGGPAGISGTIVLLSLAGLALLAVQIVTMIWLYHTATFARRSGLPAARDPLWAVLIFVVPVVGLWFPFQLARDSFPPGDPNRRCAARWWTWTIVTQLSPLPVLIAALNSQLVGYLFAALAVIPAGLAAREARVLIAALLAAHRALVPPEPAA